jgi:signal peptidase I
MWGYLAGAGLVVLALSVLIAAARRRITLVTVVGESMRPTLAAGDRVLVRRARLGQLSRGQVVVVEEPGRNGTWAAPPAQGRAGRHQWMIKRVAALPGDERPEASLPAAARQQGPRVPDGKFVLLGDNPARSYDSRQLGYFPGDRLLGVVLRRVGQP